MTLTIRIENRDGEIVVIVNGRPVVNPKPGTAHVLVEKRTPTETRIERIDDGGA